jgi:hypothetical protein
MMSKMKFSRQQVAPGELPSQIKAERDRLRAALLYVRAEAEERAHIVTKSTNPKGALEIAVTGLWNIEGEARQALGLEGQSALERAAAFDANLPL